MTDILIVEDNKQLSDVLTDFLRNEGYSVSVASDGNKALELYERYGARLLILDIMLPGVDGMYILDKVRRASNTPVLMVSAKSGKNDKLDAIISGADDYIEKPYSLGVILAKVKASSKDALQLIR